MIESKILEALKNDDKSVLKSVYLKHKSAFIGFAKTYTIDNEDALDIYQDAIIALRENALKGHLDNLKSELKTYLFSIGKYMFYKRLKEKKKLHLIHSTKETNDFEELEITDIDYNFNTRQRQLQTAFTSLGMQCRTLLNLFYMRGFTLDEIVEELNYNNKDVAKSQKSRCLKSLKKIING
ncbi:sigma-70 family RNA polymerase sigma factor [Kordia sp. YSTF-M3]|uniref:Sigma-70 family RNA polymerase sigma factor n=1 Tax=Kordia aestuariivivens TaxID=2759037 RepID=A0ABR7Q670_9FLAO|nr:sigma-70 family RNA polymerase sigma factor [Kordia aestuariivivens]MBC8754060.1 sigma-70 family RNA polymerase sigma factor [Kordia aestuariivivens]